MENFKSLKNKENHIDPTIGFPSMVQITRNNKIKLKRTNTAIAPVFYHAVD